MGEIADEIYNSMFIDDYEDFGDVALCPVCAAENEPIGTLGSRRQYKCRDCGIMWSTYDEEDEP